jgi:hypothetical protein
MRREEGEQTHPPAAQGSVTNGAKKPSPSKRKMTKAEREEMNARHERVMANVRRTYELAERAQAKLEAERSGN